MAIVPLRCAHLFLLIATAIALEFVTRSDAATINAASVSFTDVSAAVSAAVDGDTVIVPAGTASWTSTLYVTKSISIIGATSVAGDHANQPMIAQDLTVIKDDVALTGSNQVAKIIAATISPGPALFRVSGITFQLGSQTALPGAPSAAISLVSSSTQTAPADNIRIDHCNFAQLRQKAIFINGWLYPVVDHCIFNSQSTGNVFFATVSYPDWGGHAQSVGNGSWNEPSYFGTEKFTFFEDNTINNNATAVTNGCIDADSGARYVFRYNIEKNTWPGQHGSETGGYRGGRSFEIYNNIFSYTNVVLSGNLRRSGTGLVYGNTITAANVNSHLMSLTAFRENGSSWLVGGANGANVWDVNDTSNQTGNGFGGSTGGRYAAGTAAIGSGAKTLVVAGSPWVAKDWTGYSVTNLDQIDAKGFSVSSFPTSNTGNTISFSTNGSSTDINFNPGDRFEIRRVLAAMDQPGRGVGDLCTGAVIGQFQNQTTGSNSWPHEALEPWYCWNNGLNGTMNHSSATLGSNYPSVLENREYYNFNPSWAPGQPLSSGIASGPLSNRPTQCTPGHDVAINGYGPGVGYWAADQDAFYVCAAPDTWSVYYTPYAYPHPLVSAVPAPPANLHVM